MIAWILMVIVALVIIIATLGVIIVCFSSSDGEEVLGGSFFMILIAGIITLFLALPWSNHAGDLAKVTAQHHKVEIYQQRISSLENRLNNAQYPEKGVVSLDNDTPWATMMNQLSKAETKLAQVKAERADAIRSIEARRVGPMSGIIWLSGDIPEKIKEDL